MSKQLFSILILLMLSAATSASAEPLPTAKHPTKLVKSIKTRMMRVFGGKRQLEKIDYITYCLSQEVYKNGDIIASRQLWYMHLKKPLVVKLDIIGQDTVTSIISPRSAKESGGSRNGNISASLLRSRFFNFLYLLTAPEVEFIYVKQEIYKNIKVDIVRVTNKLDPSMSLDLFVSKKGEIITSSYPDPATGTYKSFGDEYCFEKVTNKISFPLHYKVVQHGDVLAGGLFSDFRVNKLSSFWLRRLALLELEQ